MTKHVHAMLLAAFLTINAGAQEKVSWPKPDPGPQMVANLTFDWKDDKRSRIVPVKIYHPKDMTKTAPIIVFSHGTGGSRETYAYLGSFWASHGYVCVHPQHAGSDAKAILAFGNVKDGLKKAVSNPQNAVERVKDVTFVLDQLAKLDKDDAAFKGKLNLDAVGGSGHSFGAHTTLAVAGQTMAGVDLRDKRVKAIIPMSAPVPKLGADRAFAGIAVPSLHMTGTLDDSPIGDTTAKERRVAYDKITKADKYFINFEGGDHMIFSGRLTKADRQLDADFQRVIKQTSLAFWDMYLKNDAKAAAWLTGNGMRDYVGKQAGVETKLMRKVE
jgi:predicted dienelactone hydrolase